MFRIPVAEALRYNAVATVSIFILPVILKLTIDRSAGVRCRCSEPRSAAIALLAMIFIDHSATLGW